MMTLTLKQSVVLPTRPLPIMSIGLGSIVHDAHYPAYRQAGFAVVGGYDLSPERTRQMQQLWALPAIYDTLQAAIDHAPADAVFDVAVPGSKILEIIRHIPDGRAVLIQKPMGENLEQARAILQVCREKNLIAAINFQMRYAPYIIAARDMLERGLIGDLNEIEVKIQVYTPWQLWSFLYGIPRMEILYHSIHYVDLIRSFLGDPQKVLARSHKHPVSPELKNSRSVIVMDYGTAAVRAVIVTNHGHIYGAEKQESYVKWEGSKGAIQVRAGLNMDYPKGRPDLLEYILLEENQPASWQTVPIKGSWFPEAFIGTMASLMRYANGETDIVPTSVEDAYRTMATVEAAYISDAQDGTPLPE